MPGNDNDIQLSAGINTAGFVSDVKLLESSVSSLMGLGSPSQKGQAESAKQSKLRNEITAKSIKLESQALAVTKQRTALIKSRTTSLTVAKKLADEHNRTVQKAAKLEAMAAAAADKHARAISGVAKSNAAAVQQARNAAKTRTQSGFSGLDSRAASSSAAIAASKQAVVQAEQDKRDALQATITKRNAAAVGVAKAVSKERSSFKTLVAAEKKLSAATAVQIKGAKKQKQATEGLSKSNAFLVRSLTNLSRVTAIVQGPLGPIAGRLTAMASALRTMGVGFLALGLSIAAVKKVFARAIPAAIDMQRTMATLSAATKDASASFALIVTESERTGAGFKKLGDSFAQLAAAARGTALEGKPVQAVFRALNTASLALRLSTVQTAGALKALEQMISKGTVSSEEMRQQLGERLPGAFRLAADSMGMTTASFSKALAKGNILATDLLPRLAAAMEKAYGKAAADSALTMGVSIEKLRNETDLFFGTLVSSRVLDSFTGSVDWATEAMKGLRQAIADDIEFAGNLAITFSVTWPLAVGLALVATFKMIAALKILRKVAKSLAAMKWLLVLFSSPWTAAAIGVTALALAIKNGMDTAREAAERLSKQPAVKRLTRQMKDLTEEINKQEKALRIISAGGFPKEQVDAKVAALDKLKGKRNELITQLDALKAKEIENRDFVVESGKKVLDALTEGNKIIIASKTRQVRGLEQVGRAEQDLRITVTQGLAEEASLRADLANQTVRFSDLLKAQADGDVERVALITAALNGNKKAYLADIRQRIAEGKRQREENLSNVEALGVLFGKLKAIVDKQTKAEKEAAAKNAARRKADGIATIKSAELVALQLKLIATKKGSDEEFDLKQKIAREKLAGEREVAIAREVSSVKRKLIVAQFVLKSKLLEKSIVDDDVSLARTKALEAARTQILVDAAITRTHLLNQKLEDLRRETAKQVNGTASDPVDIAAVRERAQQRAQLAFEDSLKANKDAETAALAAAVTSTQIAAAKAARQRADDQAELERKVAHNQALLDAEKAHQTNIADLKKQFTALGSDTSKFNAEQAVADVKSFYHRVQGWDKLGTKGRFKLVESGFDALSGLMQSKNRKLFEVGKIAAISNTVVKSIESAQSVFTSVQAEIPGIAGTVVASIAAAATLAAGYQNVRKIQATKFGGGAPSGGAARPAISGAGATAPPAPVRFDPTFNPTAAAGNTPTPQGVTIIQNISAPNAVAGQAAAIQQGAALGAQQALAAVSADFAGNGPLRSQLAI